MAMFVSMEKIDGIGCFQVGYAVPDTYRSRGWTKENLEQELGELSNGLARHGVEKFYLQAVVSLRASILSAHIGTSRKARKITQVEADLMIKRVVDIRNQTY